MNKIITVPVNDVKLENRFNPKYFHFYESKKEMKKSSKLKFEEFGNKEYINVLSDGIHSAVTLQKEGEIKYLYVKNITEGFIDTTDNIYLAPSDLMKNLSKKLEPKDVLLTVVGRLGESAMISDYMKGIISLPRNIAFMKTNSNLLKPEFLTCFLLSRFAKEQSIMSGGGNIQGLLSLTKLKKFIFPVPSMEVQKRFADMYNETLHYQNEILQNIESAKRLLRDTLSNVRNTSDNKLGYSVDINEIKENSIWTPTLYNKNTSQLLENYKNNFETFTIQELSESIKKGNEVGSINYKDYLSKGKEDIPFIRTSDIQNYEISSFPSYYVNYDLRDELNQDFHTGDIIVNNDGRIGYTAIITSKDEGVFQSHVHRIRLRNDYKHLRNYIYICLLCEDIGGVQFEKNTVVQTTIPTLASRLKNFVIPIVDSETITIINEKVEASLKAIVLKHNKIKQIKKEINELLAYD
ncbi:restriction endonuclease subunit S [Mammaliicoccus fleurettii]|uniref:restriction endonuclease subunit S n=1 Tax=Mammaliicoccus fleurettii TaxID=150056 RepID=UPI00099374C7|nr:restriction endonuclease subunit S [Mammaliicoccus fleurettii]OOV77605.1 hypothetical protein B2G86_04430 [Mammaliicoccus fleurettii]